MTQIATPETVIANFDDVYVSDVHGDTMHLEQRDDEFWATFTEPGSAESTIDQITRQVVLITGSHHQRVTRCVYHLRKQVGSQKCCGVTSTKPVVVHDRWALECDLSGVSYH